MSEGFPMYKRPVTKTTQKYTQRFDVDVDEPKVEKRKAIPVKELAWMVARMKALYAKVSRTAPCWDYIRAVEAMITS